MKYLLLGVLLIISSCADDKATCINRLLYRMKSGGSLDHYRTEVTPQQAIDACKDFN